MIFIGNSIRAANFIARKFQIKTLFLKDLTTCPGPDSVVTKALGVLVARLKLSYIYIYIYIYVDIYIYIYICGYVCEYIYM